MRGGMFGSEAFLVNCKRAPQQHFGFRKPVGILQQRRQVVKSCGDRGMIRAEALLIHGHLSAAERLGLARSVEFHDLLVECFRIVANLRFDRAHLSSQ